MFKLIKNGRIVSAPWRTLTLAEGDTSHSVRLPVGPVLVPLSVWQARRAELIHREYEHGWPLGIWLAAEENAEEIEHDIDDFTVIAIEFDKFTDGKGLSSVRLLRERYGYEGELRAIGDVPLDWLAFQHHVHFDSFAVSEIKNTNRIDGAVLSGWFNFNSDNQSERLAVAGLI
ncbi:MAG: DUF934 domain-containing protein [Gallionella sp.]